MMLLIDFLEEAALRLHALKEKIIHLESLYQKSHDPDVKTEMSHVQAELRREEGRIAKEILLNLEEFRMVRKYFPEIFDAFAEDDAIGKMIKGKSFLLDFKHVPVKEAQAEFERIRSERLALRKAKAHLSRWAGSINHRMFFERFPMLKPEGQEKPERDELLEIIRKKDAELRKKGWMVLLNEPLIMLPLQKYSALLLEMEHPVENAKKQLEESAGQGTLAEANAKRGYMKIKKLKNHYRAVIEQVFLANPDFLRSFKKRRSWLSREKKGILEKIAEGLVPARVSERSWLTKMNKRVHALKSGK